MKNKNKLKSKYLIYLIKKTNIVIKQEGKLDWLIGWLYLNKSKYKTIILKKTN